jgi:hypothetical protein
MAWGVAPIQTGSPRDLFPNADRDERARPTSSNRSASTANKI